MRQLVTDTVNDILLQADAFFRLHKGEPSVEATFKYFTDHPVAPLNRKRLAMLLESVEQHADRAGRRLRVLDLACGGGLITCAIAQLGHRSLGLDLSPKEVGWAYRFAADGKHSGDFAVVDLIEDPAWERSVEATLNGKPDIVVLAYALHHLPRVEEFVARLGRWLDADSRLVINEENPQSPMFQLKHAIRTWVQKDTDVEWHRTYRGWRKILDERGFQTMSPGGADVVPGLATIAPGLCWSLVFTARRTNAPQAT